MNKEPVTIAPKRRMGPMGAGPIIGGPAEKPKDFKRTMKQLIGSLRSYWVKLTIVFIFAIVSTIFAIVAPKILGQATNQIVDDYISIKAYDGLIKKLPSNTQIPIGTTGAMLMENASPVLLERIPADNLEKLKSLDLSKRPTFHFDKIGLIIMSLILLYVLSLIFSYFQVWIMSGVTQSVTFGMRKNISQKINRLPLKYFDSKTYGEVLSRITNDVDTVGRTLNQSLSQILTSVVMIIGIIAMMLSISATLTVVIVLILPVSFILIRFIMKRSQPHFVKHQQYLSEINGHVEEMYAGHLVMRVFNGEQSSIDKFNKINDRLYKSAWKSQFSSGVMPPLMSFVGNLGYVGVAVAGGWLAINGKIKIGDIQAFIQYVQQFNQPIIQTANIANVMQSAAAAAERVFEFIGEDEDSSEENIKKVPANIKGKVEFKDVVFGYNEDKIVIDHLSVDIKAGQRVAIVGPTGAGKTTLVNLLMRFYDVKSGYIKIDGVDIREYKRSDVRKMFGMVLQDTWLFNGTIRDNILYSNPKASEKDMIEAAKQANVDHFVHSLPKGYDMVLNEEANNISQGEKQLLTIARAMIAHTPMLILDEATSSVDTRTEILIQKAMDKLMEGKTSFVIAHRLSTIRDADLILVMNSGNVVEQGNHQQLMSKNGFYAKLYNSQFVGREI